MGFYTIQRTTRDIDLVVEPSKISISKLLTAFQDSFYCYEPSITDAVNHNSMFNFIENATGLKIDFILRKNTEYDRLAFERKQYLNLGENKDLNFWVITLEDLIIAKLRWIQTLQSERQIEDIKNLLLNPTIDKDYLSKWIMELHLDNFSIDFKF